MKGRPKPWSKRKRYCRKKGGGGGKFSFSGRPASWGISSLSFSDAIKERLSTVFKPLSQPAPNKLMRQRLNRFQPPANKVEKEEIK